MRKRSEINQRTEVACRRGRGETKTPMTCDSSDVIAWGLGLVAGWPVPFPGCPPRTDDYDASSELWTRVSLFPHLIVNCRVEHASAAFFEQVVSPSRATSTTTHCFAERAIAVHYYGVVISQFEYNPAVVIAATDGPLVKRLYISFGGWAPGSWTI